jgi:molybdopterin synthase catalytic subunit
MKLRLCHHLPEVNSDIQHINIMETIYLTAGPISPEILLQFINKMGEKSDSGGHTIFLGQVRADIVEGKKVKAIEYSAYVEMVNAEAENIKALIYSEFEDIRSVDIIHSTGLVKAGEISLLVVVSAGHRHQSINGCAKTVELIKERLPVWKKEIFDDNSHHWK